MLLLCTKINRLISLPLSCEDNFANSVKLLK